MDHQTRWMSSSPRPTRFVLVGDTVRADRVLAMARHDQASLWRGDYRQARQVLSAVKRRLAPENPPSTFQAHRRSTATRARLLSRLVVELSPDHRLDLPHAPDTSQACARAFGPTDVRYRLPLQDLVGVLAADQWRGRGIHVPALNARIHPHYGVFPPTRQDYLDLVATTPLPRGARSAFDVGTGTGVLAALLARKGVGRVTATDLEPRAVACARDNLTRLGVDALVSRADLFPDGKADLVVCNPPWLPGTPTSTVDAAVHDPDSRMLRGFLAGLGDHLAENGEAWLILSDLAERLGLRAPAELPTLIAEAGLTVTARHTTLPRHRLRPDDPFAAHRARRSPPCGV
ncbi:methyltransferase [Umezawaea sp. NPDC059074]|uniref:methyltransferase n=1 Tax=Umezawaea sp. NPDC059074 TaxID=3346716 RepID=UPI0036AF0736